MTAKFLSYINSGTSSIVPKILFRDGFLGFIAVSLITTFGLFIQIIRPRSLLTFSVSLTPVVPTLLASHMLLNIRDVMKITSGAIMRADTDAVAASSTTGAPRFSSTTNRLSTLVHNQHERRRRSTARSNVPPGVELPYRPRDAEDHLSSDEFELTPTEYAFEMSSIKHDGGGGGGSGDIGVIVQQKQGFPRSPYGDDDRQRRENDGEASEGEGEDGNSVLDIR